MGFNDVLIGSVNVEALVAYYTKLFGPPVFVEGPFTGWRFGDGFLSIGPHEEVNGRSPQPVRCAWSMETPDVQREFAKLKAAGAIVIRRPRVPKAKPGVEIATLADPDGNRFQLTGPVRSA